MAGAAPGLKNLITLAGIVCIMAGLAVLWHSRKDVMRWIEDYFRTWEAMLRMHDPGAPAARSDLAERGGLHKKALRMTLAFGLTFFGILLFTLGLAL